jgi:alginate O-acetyltransferase complex protein AlgI
MLFYEPLFLGIFFPTLYAVYLALNERTTARKWTLLVGSAAFYSWGEPLFVPVLFVSSFVDYRLARLMERTKPPWRRSIIIAVGVVARGARLLQICRLCRGKS